MKRGMKQEAIEELKEKSRQNWLHASRFEHAIVKPSVCDWHREKKRKVLKSPLRKVIKARPKKSREVQF